MDHFQHIKLNKEDGVAFLWLARPEKRNAINHLMAREITGAIQQLEADNHTIAVILRGEGSTFSAGADLGWINQQELPQEEQPPRVLATLFHTLYTFKKPLIAFVHGNAMGGALGLLAAADYVLATTQARLSFAEVRRGLIPATISPYVVRRCGEFRARQLMLSGTVIDAAEGKDAGLIDILVNENLPYKALNHLCSEFKRNAPGAMAGCKELLVRIAGSPLDDQLLEYTAAALERARGSDEAREGMQAFLEKRDPSWIKDRKHEADQ